MTSEINDDVRYALREHFADAAEWRDGKASEYPDDARNAGARDELCSLRDSVAEIPEEMISSYVRIRERVEPCRVSEIEAEVFRSIGFRSGWESATAFLESLRDNLAREAGLDLRRMDVQGLA